MADAGVTEIAVSTGEVPVPLRDALCGLPGPLSETLILPVRLPVALGAKTRGGWGSLQVI